MMVHHFHPPEGVEPRMSLIVCTSIVANIRYYIGGLQLTLNEFPIKIEPYGSSIHHLEKRTMDMMVLIVERRGLKTDCSLTSVDFS